MTNSLAALRSVLRPWARDLVTVASQAGVNPRVTSTLRSYSYQARLYRDYLAGRNQYPVAPPGSSAHEIGLAFDMVCYPMSALAELGRVWEEWGGIWGGRFGDEVHFEFPGASQHAVAQGDRAQKNRETPWWLWTPDKGAEACDWLYGKVTGAIIQAVDPDNPIGQAAGSPCSTALKVAKKADCWLGFC